MWHAMLYWLVLTSNGMIAVNPGPHIAEKFQSEEACTRYVLANWSSFGAPGLGQTYHFKCVQD